MAKRKLWFYISSRASQRNLSKELTARLKIRGYKETLDWTKYAERGLRRPYNKNPKAPDVADKMIVAIKRADVFILFPDLRGGTGMFVELGVALAANKKVFIVAPQITRPIFFFHTLITHVRSIKELLERI